jgi:hypothetical protein
LVPTQRIAIGTYPCGRPICTVGGVGVCGAGPRSYMYSTSELFYIGIPT